MVQLERTFKDQQIQLPAYFRANKKLKYLIEGIVQAPFEH